MSPQLSEQLPPANYENIPRYLYRVYAPDSNGHNTTAIISAAAWNDNRTVQQLPRLTFGENKAMLKAHFQWQYFEGDRYVSWTNSILYALQFAVRKTRKISEKLLVSDEDDLRICVLDTSLIGDTSRFIRASELLSSYMIEDNRKLPHKYFTTEYILYGGLNIEGSSRTVSLSELRGEGLFDLIPELDDEDKKPQLWLRVDELRRSIARTNCPVSVHEGSLALWIAFLFGGAFTMPVMIALLSVRRRKLDDERFLRIVRDIADSKRDLLNPYKFRPANAVDAPEVANFEFMMNVAFNEMRKTKLRGLLIWMS